MKTRKVLGPYDIPIEVLKCMEMIVLSWLINYLKKITITKKMLDQWKILELHQLLLDKACEHFETGIE